MPADEQEVEVAGVDADGHAQAHGARCGADAPDAADHALHLARGAARHLGVPVAVEEQQHRVAAPLHERRAVFVRGGEQLLDHVALCGDEHDPLAWPGRRLDDAERVKVEDRVVERHRHLVLSLKAHRGGELLAICHGGKLERPHHRALIGDADANAL